MSEQNKRRISGVFATYRATVKSLTGEQREVTRTAVRGEEVELSAAEEARLDANGALAPKGTSAEEIEAQVRATIERSISTIDGQEAPAKPPVSVSPPAGGGPPDGTLLLGDTGQATPPADAATAPSSGAAPPAEAESAYDARGQSLADVQAWLDEAKPNAGDTVAAAHDDAGAAETLLEAERLTHGGDQRTTVAEPLQRIIDSE